MMPRSSAHALTGPRLMALSSLAIARVMGSDMSAQIAPLIGHPCAAPESANSRGRRAPPSDRRESGWVQNV
eukprot:5508052-Pyramimonas_sp.AAC.2